jgi:hypothetical protein
MHAMRTMEELDLVVVRCLPRDNDDMVGAAAMMTLARATNREQEANLVVWILTVNLNDS